MANLLEVEYEKIFSPKTIASLKGKSGESLRQMLGNKGLMQTMMRTQGLLDEIVDAEEGYRDELEMVAAQMVTDAYPIIDYANIKIDAKIVGMNDLDIPNPPPQEDPTLPDFGEGDPEKLKAKRRIINGITQGASIRGAFGFMLFKEYLDAINPALVDKYNEILKLAFGIYDDENAIAMMLAALAQGQKAQGGESEMEYDEENEQFVIKAKAICFPMLVHEIVKGLYEIVGTEGFGADKEKNQAIVGAVDKLSNEPNDLRFGKFLYDAINKLYAESNVEDARVRELFFAELYKLEEDEFLSFVENAVNDELTPSEKQWALGTMKDIEKDLRKDDTGLEDLDELSIKESQLVVENNNIITNYTVDRESEKAVLAKIPYVTGNGDEKSLSVWVPKSTLEKNNGIPTWIVQKHLETLKDKGYRYDTSNIMRTLGKTAADIAAAAPQKKSEQPIFWNFEVDNNVIEFGRARLSQDDVNKFTKLIKFTDNKPNNKEKAQQVIDQLVNKYNLDKLPLVVWKTLAKSEKNADYLTDMDPFKFNNVSTKEDRYLSRYFTTPEHARIL